MVKSLLSILFILSISGCAYHGSPTTVSLPLLTAWYEGQAISYVTTDVSDKTMAAMINANYAPRLANAIPSYPKPPQVKTLLERVYAFPNGEQSRTVFASIPTPLGADSTDKNYSPVWLMYTITWVSKDNVQELKSEADIFKAEAQNWITITRTNVVVNCPIVSIDGQTFLNSK
jgi:hypothetical protein